jgi:hypothetical protein
MANRLQHKPDPAIKKNVRKARLGARAAKRAQSFVVTASLAVTILGWVLFSHEEAQENMSAQLTDPTPIAAVVSTAPTVTPVAVAISQSSR